MNVIDKSKFLFTFNDAEFNKIDAFCKRIDNMYIISGANDPIQ